MFAPEYPSVGANPPAFFPACSAVVFWEVSAQKRCAFFALQFSWNAYVFCAPSFGRAIRPRNRAIFCWLLRDSAFFQFLDRIQSICDTRDTTAPIQ